MEKVMGKSATTYFDPELDKAYQAGVNFGKRAGLEEAARAMCGECVNSEPVLRDGQWRHLYGGVRLHCYAHAIHAIRAIAQPEPKRENIDKQFEGMANDEQYKREALEVVEGMDAANKISGLTCWEAVATPALSTAIAMKRYKDLNNFNCVKCHDWLGVMGVGATFTGEIICKCGHLNEFNAAPAAAKIGEWRCKKCKHAITSKSNVCLEEECDCNCEDEGYEPVKGGSEGSHEKDLQIRGRVGNDDSNSVPAVLPVHEPAAVKDALLASEVPHIPIMTMREIMEAEEPSQARLISPTAEQGKEGK